MVVDDCRLLEPGHWALLWFDGDDVWHQRLLLWPSRRDKSRFVCVTPDEEIYEEPFLEVDPLNHSIASYGLDGRLSRPSGLRQDVYGFDEEPSKDDILGWLEIGRAEGQRLLAAAGETLRVEPEFWMWGGFKKGDINSLEDVGGGSPQHRLPKKGPSGPSPKKEGKPVDANDDFIESQIWMSMEKTAHSAVGDIIGEADVVMSVGLRGIARVSSSEFFVYHIDEAKAKEALQEILRAMVAEWRDASWVDEDVDARVLPIIYHGGRVEKRYRRWRQVADSVTEEAFDDWPLEDQVRSADWLIQQIGKVDRGPVEYIEAYLSKHSYQPSDRSQHELRCLSEILEVAGCYDQLNLSSLAFVEMLSRRWQMIVDAHARNPLAPNYEASEFYSGSRRGRQGIAPMLSAHVARSMKDESEIDKQRNKARDAHGKGGKHAKGDHSG